MRHSTRLLLPAVRRHDLTVDSDAASIATSCSKSLPPDSAWRLSPPQLWRRRTNTRRQDGDKTRWVGLAGARVPGDRNWAGPGGHAEAERAAGGGPEPHHGDSADRQRLGRQAR